MSHLYGITANLMPILRLPLLLLLCWLALGHAHAQTQPPRPPATPAPTEQLVVRVELPSLVGKVAKLAGTLFSSKEKEKLPELRAAANAELTSNPVLVLRLPLPRFLSDTKPTPSPPK